MGVCRFSKNANKAAKRRFSKRQKNRRGGKSRVENDACPAFAGADRPGAVRHERAARPDGGGDPHPRRAAGTSHWTGLGELFFGRGRASPFRSGSHRDGAGMRADAFGVLYGIALRGGRTAAPGRHRLAGRLPGGVLRPGRGGKRKDCAHRVPRVFLHPDRAAGQRGGKDRASVDTAGGTAPFHHDPFAAGLRKDHAPSGSDTDVLCGRRVLPPAGVRGGRAVGTGGLL